MDTKTPKKNRLHYIRFTLLFLIAALVIYAPFILMKKSLVWEHDSYTQHVKAMVFISRWYRQSLKALVTGNWRAISTYSFSIGYGSDAFTTLAYYGVGDPFNFLSVFVPAKYIYIFYNALIPLKNYLAGLVFYALCFSRWPSKEHEDGCIAGALIYAFCGFALITCIGQPIFLNTLIIFPLVLNGIEKVRAGKKPWLFILSIFLATTSNFYFVVSIVLMAVLYALFRYIPFAKGEIGRRFKEIAVMFAGGTVGVAMGGIILLPMALTVFANKRVSLNPVINPFYEVKTCRMLPVSFLACKEVEYGALCYAGTALLCVFLLFSSRGFIKRKLQFLLYSVLLFVPAFGYLTNGFSYPINRWCWAYSALIGMLVAEVWPGLFTLTARQKGVLTTGLTVYFVICCFLDYNLDYVFLLPAAFSFITLLYLLRAQKQQYEAPAVATAAAETAAADTDESGTAAAIAMPETDETAPAVSAAAQAPAAEDAAPAVLTAIVTPETDETAPAVSAAAQAPTAGDTAPAAPAAAGTDTAGTSSAAPASVEASSAASAAAGRRAKAFRRAQRGILYLTIAGICVNGVVKNYPDFLNRVKTYKELDCLAAFRPGSGASPANDLNMWVNDTTQITTTIGYDTTKFLRVSNTEPGFWYQNTSILSGVSSTQSFWSVNNPYNLEYLEALGVSDVNNNAWQFTNLDNRTILNELASVSYLYCLYPEKLPAGYDITSLDLTTANSVYANKKPLPLGYTYKKTISREKFDALSPAQRQELLLSYAVTETNNVLNTPASAQELASKLECRNVPYKVNYLTDGVVQTDPNTFVVSALAEEAQVELSFDPVTAGELYILMKNIQFRPTTKPEIFTDDPAYDPQNFYSSEMYGQLTNYEKYWMYKEIFEGYTEGNIKIHAVFNSDGEMVTENEVNYILPEDEQFYSGRQDFLLNSCNITRPLNSIVITFPRTGIYHFDEFALVSEPLTSYEDKIAELAAEPLENTDIRQNASSFVSGGVTGEITVSGNKLLCLTIPYSDGWKAYVDGAPAVIEKVNLMFSGLWLTPGHHTIELRYETPGLLYGICLTAAGFLLFLLWVILARRAGKKTA